MAIGTALHDKTKELCSSLRWKTWSGYFAPCSYDTSLDYEYSAVRNRAGVLDVSPLYKQLVVGADAERLLDRLVPRDVTKCRVGQVLYSPWCDAEGKVLDDGTIQRLGEDRFRLTSAYPALTLLESSAHDLDVEISDDSTTTAGLSLQGPNARHILQAVEVAGIEDLKYFRLLEASIAGVDLTVTRTGYTGDLGYEIWIPAADAPRVWDALMERGEAYGITPFGLDTLDVVRMEAGLILIDVDYYSARMVSAESRKSSPFEIGLGWAVNPKKRGAYVGKAALAAERAAGSAWALVGLDVNFDEIRALYEAKGVPPEIHLGTDRSSVPLYSGGGVARRTRQVGYATSRSWSPVLKKSLALATVQSAFAASGTRLEIEYTVEHERHVVSATVVDRPFFDPPRKKS